MNYISDFATYNRFEVLATLEEEEQDVPTATSQNQVVLKTSPSKAQPVTPNSSVTLKKIAFALGSFILLSGGLTVFQSQSESIMANGTFIQHSPRSDLFIKPIKILSTKDNFFFRPKECTILNLENIDRTIECFIKIHKQEFISMTTKLRETKNIEKNYGKFTVLGNGISKVSVSNEDFPDYIFKIPLTSSSRDDLKKHVREALVAEKAINDNGYKHIIATKPILFEDDTLMIAVEPQMEFIPYETATRLIPQEELLEAEEELTHFASNTTNSDLALHYNHNAEFVFLNGQYKICIYDFDHAGEGNVRDPLSLCCLL